MNNNSPRGILFAAGSLVFQLFYILMYIPVWGSYTLTLSGGAVIVLFVFQLVAACLAALRIVLLLCHRSLTAISANIFDFIAVLSVLLTCFVGFFFTLELLGIPWFPAQR